MCWMCDHPGSTIDDYLDQIRAKIDRHRWAVQYVESDRTPYAYTIGLHGLGAAEMLVTGLSPRGAQQMLNRVAEMVLRGRLLEPDHQIQLPAGPLIEVVEIDHPDVHMAMALAINDCPFRALQLVWADGHGHLPWAAGFDHNQTRQPVLGVRASHPSGANGRAS